jgi:uncharacterized protein (DUF885 family)
MTMTMKPEDSARRGFGREFGREFDRRSILRGSAGAALAALMAPSHLSIAKSLKGAGDADLDAFFIETFQARLRTSPELRVYLGEDSTSGLWDDESQAALARQDRQWVDDLARLRSGFPDDGLSAAARLNKRLWIDMAEDRLAEARWRQRHYVADHFNGRHGGLIDFLSIYQPVRTQAEAQAWIRLAASISAPVAVMIEALNRQADEGVIAPRFSLAKTKAAILEAIKGQPFEVGAASDSALFTAFAAQVATLSLNEAERSALLTQARQALEQHLGPAYRRLAETIANLERRGDDRDGVWKLPDGDAYYRWLLRHHTTLDVAPDAVHALGIKEVARIHAEMQAIITKVGFQGDRAAFQRFLRDDRQFFFPDTPEGRQAYIDGADAILQRIAAVLSGQFGLKPQARLEVRRFDLYREASETIARYNPPAQDGSRPGIYNVNLSNMKEMPRWQMEVLAFHEGIPGHHMQIALAQEMKNLPDFRRHEGHNAYVEGWALYSERLPKQLGFYQDPYSDFGRLTFELWRALRLVIDTGLHAKRWTRQQAIDYFVANSAFSREVAEREVDRYIVFPGQACAYYLGLLHILELRRKAEQALGPRFDVKAFHDAILANGSVPLPILSTVIDDWIKTRQI